LNLAMDAGFGDLLWRTAMLIGVFVIGIAIYFWSTMPRTHDTLFVAAFIGTMGLVIILIGRLCRSVMSDR
jgi:heme A synthase